MLIYRYPASEKRIMFDIVVGGSIGLGMGAYWWYGLHMPKVEKKDAFYAELKAKKHLEDN
ncbi:hypothetical protein BABINDRAFT_8580 [Babjeviella inositovora NRRL Y-12698]|uniref:Cytochrome c oxidase polypeptide VIIA n=1 Tax=Babjeviella inositovora NRRL Y-12698 TaxID=984486 RepID=A0A1E3QMP9_9ASCO|nr:uncharacterized protein BABINDRAFT_8580 [Babjeviella inositovora NRRL Y-12698]ODQ78955.1 hypothetical protein BABINDRAFT_8580 [Babjeviella inositovora NRRL Y-12698]